MYSPAKGIFAFEFNESEKYGSGEYISPLGEVFCTVNIAGAVTAVELSPLSGKVTARVSDPTGVFIVYAGKKDSSAGSSLFNAPVPSFISVTGESGSKGGMHIVADAVVSIDREMRNSWIKYVSRETIERMEKKISVAEGDESGNLKEICRYAGYVERALDAVSEYSGGEGAPAATDASPDNSEKILELIGLHSGEKGVLIEELIRISASFGFTETDVKGAIKSLLEDGECYLPAGGFIRRL
ncbi:MAG: hypothetical protein JW931_07065 [Methanomicrobiaceae archaeon]|nr:hypothetical protein [Methanomicrobiaceae archaeon]